MDKNRKEIVRWLTCKKCGQTFGNTVNLKDKEHTLTCFCGESTVLKNDLSPMYGIPQPGTSLTFFIKNVEPPKGD